MLKAIETRYQGYRMRSRLEARWAVFFDALDIPYEYEKEGYELGEAGWYLPDFWLPKLDCWVEIKPNWNESELLKPSALAWTGRQNVFVLCGFPGVMASDGLGALDYSKTYTGIAFIGDHVKIEEWRYLDFVAGRNQFRSLYDFLKDRQSDGFSFSAPIPLYDGTEDSARKLIDLDREYYREKYGREHPHWQPYNRVDGVTWGKIGHHDWTLEPFFEGWNHGSLRRASEAVRQARFE